MVKEKSEYIECPYCKEQIKSDAIKCKHCRSAIKPENPGHGGICPFCKEEIKPEAVKCKHCGTVLLASAGGCDGCAKSQDNLQVPPEIMKFLSATPELSSGISLQPERSGAARIGNCSPCYSILTIDPTTGAVSWGYRRCCVKVRIGPLTVPVCWSEPCGTVSSGTVWV